MKAERRLQLLCELCQHIYDCTLDMHTTGIPDETLPTSADLARRYKLPGDDVKKLLKLLKDWGLIRPIGLNPKRYQFDEYHFPQLTDTPLDDPMLESVVDFMTSRNKVELKS
jgi:hypothetical protein